MAQFTDMTARMLKPQKSPVVLSVGKGLYFRVTPAGKRQWLFRKMSEGKNIHKVLGEYPLMTLAQAKQEAKEQCQFLTDNRTKQEVIPTLGQLQSDWLNNHQHLRPNSLIVIRRCFKNLSSLQDIPFPELGPAQFIPLLKQMCQAGKIASAHSTVTYLAQVERFAYVSGVIETPRLQFLRELLPHHEVVHHRSIHSSSLQDLFAGIKELKKVQDKDLIALKVLLFTLSRSTECIHMQWDWVDLDKDVITFPASIMKKKKEHRVPICKQLHSLLAKPQQHSKYCLLDLGFVDKSFHRDMLRHAFKRLGIADKLTVHGVRSLARTWFAEQDFNYLHSEACLSHQAENATQLSYQRSDYLEQRRDIMQAWADFVESCYSPYFPD